jgi:hypothetical protein
MLAVPSTHTFLGLGDSLVIKRPDSVSEQPIGKASGIRGE